MLYAHVAQVAVGDVKVVFSTIIFVILFLVVRIDVCLKNTKHYLYVQQLCFVFVRMRFGFW